MALGTAAGAILGGAAAAGTSFGLSQMFGGGGSGDWKAAMPPVAPVGINAGGLRSSFSGGNLMVRPTAERMALISQLQGILGNQAGEIAGMRGGVAPGMSDLRAARMAEIEGARERAVGNLRDNLARRRVQGSSFGQDAISRGEAEFAKLKDKSAAETFLQELQLTNEMMTQEFTVRRQAVQTGLDELNLQAGIAAQLTSKATETMQKNAQFMAEMTMKEAQARGTFFGKISEPFSAGIGKGVTSLFT